MSILKLIQTNRNNDLIGGGNDGRSKFYVNLVSPSEQMALHANGVHLRQVYGVFMPVDSVEIEK